LDALGLEWKVERRNLGWAKATRTSYKDSIFELGQDVMLWYKEARRWARRDMFGTRFSSQEELEKACEFYIPNKIYLVLPWINEHRINDEGSGLIRPFFNFASNQQLALRDKLWRYAVMYQNKGFAINAIDFWLDEERSIKSGLGEDVGWPLFGVLIGGHGNRNGIKMRGGFLTPYDFQDPRTGGYGLGLVYAFGCFQGFLPWQNMASANGFWYVSPDSPTSQYVMPTPKLPSK
jgi:hypothetical protein